MNIKKIVSDNLQKIESIKEESKAIYKTLQAHNDIRQYTIKEYEKINNEIIQPNEKRQQILTIQKAICYNNLAAVSYELFKNKFIDELKQFKNKNIGEKTTEKINKILENILLDNGLKARCYYNLNTFLHSNVLTFTFILLDKEGYSYGRESEFLSIRLEIPTSFHLFDKIEEATTNTSDLEIVEAECIEDKAKYLQIQHNLICKEIDETIKKLAKKRSDFTENIKGNLYNIKSLEINYQRYLY